jgi:hypothetical protein
VGQPPNVRHISQGLNALLQFEVPKILLHDIGHGHAQPGREILSRHRLLLFEILQEPDQAVRKPLRVSRRIEFDGQLLALRHLPEVGQVSADDRYAIGTGQVSNAAASRGRRVWHDRDGGTLKQVRQCIFGDIAPELDARVLGAQLPDQVGVARCLWMVSPGNHQLCVWQLLSDEVKSLYHQLETFVGSPLAERQNSVLGISAPGEVREFRPARKNAMRTKVHVIAPVLVVEDLAIAGHQHRHRVREQQHSRSHGARKAIEPFMSHPDILQFHRIH